MSSLNKHTSIRRYTPETGLRPIRLGTVISAAHPAPFDLSDEMLGGHLAVLGVSGGGKSKLLELYGRRLMASGERGLCVIDPHGDLAEDLLAFAAHRYGERGDVELLKRVHYIFPGKGILPRYDPFKRPTLTLPRWGHIDVEEAWLQAKADKLAEVLQLNQGQDGFESMPRLQRVLRNCLYACGVNIDGRHLPVADALVLLDIFHPRHHAVYARVAPFLDDYTRSDFAVLHSFKRVSEFRQETESTFNRLRTFLSGVVPAMFTTDGAEPTIDWHEIVRSKGIVLVNLRETQYFSREQKNALGKLFIHEVITAIANTPRPDRRAFSFVIDEAGEFLIEDLKRALGAVRKYKLSITLAGQDLSTFKSEKVDMRNKILSQCGTVICFQQQSEEDLELLQPRLGRGNYDFTKLVQETQFHAGYDIEEWEDHGESFMEGENWGTSRSSTQSESQTNSRSDGGSEQDSWSSGHGTSRGTSMSERTSTSSPEPGKLVYKTDRTEGRQDGESFTDSSGGSKGRSWSESTGDTKGFSTQEGESKGASRSKTTSVTKKKQLIAKYDWREQETGSLVDAISDQAERQKVMLSNLQTGEAIVKSRWLPHAFIIRSDFVRDLFENAKVKFKILDWFEGVVFAEHAYHAVPQLKGNQEARLTRFLGGDAQTPTAPPTDPVLGGAEKQKNPYGD